IEHKGSIPEELRTAIGGRIFGCDDCLDACPWNDHARAARENRFAAADPERAFPNLVHLLDLLESDRWFQERFRGTPLLRTGRARLRRNVCIALGNVGDSRALDALRQAGGDLDPVVQEHARWAIAQIEARRRPD
ncbi:MAG: epoxyqueuosine reductase, partial [Armatimonadaceae bacterium]